MMTLMVCYSDSTVITSYTDITDREDAIHLALLDLRQNGDYAVLVTDDGECEWDSRVGDE
jgi:hypothetical protein